MSNHMTVMRTPQGKIRMRTRLTLFPASGHRIPMDIRDDYKSDGNVLRYTDTNGSKDETTLGYAIERIPEDHEQTPFHAILRHRLRTNSGAGH